MSRMEEFESTLKEVVHAKRLSASKMNKLSEIAMRSMKNDTQLVSILYRTHKTLSSSEKVNSLYVFDAIVRAAKHQANKHGSGSTSQPDHGTAATFLLKIEGILDGLFQDMASYSSSSKEKTQKILDIWSKGNTFSPEVISRLRDISNRKQDKKDSRSISAPLISTTPPGSPPSRPVIVIPPAPAPTSSAPDPQATLMALLAKAAQVSLPEFKTGLSAAPPHLDPSQLDLLQQVRKLAQAPVLESNPSGQTLLLPQSSQSSILQATQSYPRPSSPDILLNQVSAPRGTYNNVQYASSERGNSQDRTIHPKDGVQTGFRASNESRRNWNNRERVRERGHDRSPPRGPRRSRSRSPPPRGPRIPNGPRREPRPYSPPRRTSVIDSATVDPRRPPQQLAGKDEFGRDLRPESPSTSTASQVTPTPTPPPQTPAFHPMPLHRPTPDPRQPKSTSVSHSDDASATAEASDTVSYTSIPPTDPVSTTSATSSVSQLGMNSFDFASFNFMDPKSWETVGNLWQVSYGYMPSQEELMQFVLMGGMTQAATMSSNQQSNSNASNIGSSNDTDRASALQMTKTGGMGINGDSHYSSHGVGMEFGKLSNGIDRDNHKQWNHHNVESSAIVLAGGQASSENQQQSTSAGRMQRVGDKWIFVREPVSEAPVSTAG